MNHKKELLRGLWVNLTHSTLNTESHKGPRCSLLARIVSEVGSGFDLGLSFSGFIGFIKFRVYRV